MNTTAVERLRRRATAATRAAFYASRPGRFLAATFRPRAVVLLYHRIAEPALDPHGQAVSRANFAGHLEVLRSRYDVSDVRTLLEDVRTGALRDGTVAVTFDDGYADVLHHAAPAAADQRVPLQLFVTVAPVVAGEPYWWDELAAAVAADAELAGGRGNLHDRLKRLPAERRRAELEAISSERPERNGSDFGRPMTVQELRAFARLPGMTVGAHTATHPSLAALTEAEQRRELVESRELLQVLTGSPVDVVAYPFGKEPDVSATTRALAAQAGYTAGFTSIAKLVTRRSDLYALPRISVHDWSEETFADRLRSIFGF
jgi:peptidoglycan/xylan/chitin deacetylase (PgdA/CDA1 family)